MLVYAFNNIRIFSYIMEVSFSGGSRTTRRKPPTCRKSLTKRYTHKYILIHPVLVVGSKWVASNFIENTNVFYYDVFGK